MIVVFGSINVDLIAGVERLPHAGETLVGRSFSTSPGGKGANQALAARRAGALVAMYGAVGRDPFAKLALALLRADGVDVENVRSVDTATGVALIHVDVHGENAITVVAGANARAEAGEVADDALGPSTTVVMQLETPQAEVAALARRAHAAGSCVILNAAPAAALPLDVFDNIDVLVVNEHEGQALADALRMTVRPEAFVVEFHARFNADAIVSLGARGLVASSASGPIALASPSVHVVDTIGAGDALVGAIAAALDRSAPWIRALKEGVAAGAVACTRAGAQASLPYRHEISALADTI
jgi:ribokinase